MRTQNATNLVQSADVIVLYLLSYIPAITPPKTNKTVCALYAIVPHTVYNAC